MKKLISLRHITTLILSSAFLISCSTLKDEPDHYLSLNKLASGTADRMIVNVKGCIVSQHFGSLKLFQNCSKAEISDEKSSLDVGLPNNIKKRLNLLSDNQVCVEVTGFFLRYSRDVIVTGYGVKGLGMIEGTGAVMVPCEIRAAKKGPE